MPLENMMARPITGIHPFNELPIDAEKWREAHDHHHLHRQLHAVSVHRPGIIWGLEVVPSTSREHTILVAPGIGIDADGQTVILSEPLFFTLEEKGQIYITLSFLQVRDRNSAITVGGGQQYFREVEGRDVKATKDLPKTAFLELARIFRTSADKPIRNAANACDPENDELNLLHRRVAFPHCYADIGVGELAYVPADGSSDYKPNRAGLWNLLREGNGRGFHLDFTGILNLRAPSAGSAPTLLYVAGHQGFQPLADAEVEGLRDFLASGGLLLGEACAGNTGFSQSFNDLTAKLGAKLKKVSKGHPLLTAHHIFSAPPPGANESGGLGIDDEAGVLFSSHDYGAAWQGEIPEPNAADARERIRQAQEFGLNMITFAARRRRLRELSRLG